MSGTAGHWLPKRLGLRPASAAKAEVTVEVLNNSEPRTGLPSLKKKKMWCHKNLSSFSLLPL